MINIGYHLDRSLASLIKKIYRLKSYRFSTHRIHADLYYFSGTRDLKEQTASIYSFLTHIGIPDQIIVVSDGSHSGKEIGELKKIHPCIQVTPWNKIIHDHVPEAILKYAARFPLGKKIAFLYSLRINKPTIYADSDILFYKNGKALRDLLIKKDRFPLYLPDYTIALDRRFFSVEEEIGDSVNSGFMILYQTPSWQEALERGKQATLEPDYFTEQTTIHVMMHANQAQPLDTKTFVMHRKDQTTFVHTEDYSGITMRHFVGPIRHKFWTSLLR